MKSICKVAALKVQCKQRYCLLKIRKYNCLQKRLDWDYSWVLDITNPYICINPSSGIWYTLCLSAVRSSVFEIPTDAVLRQQWIQFMFDYVPENDDHNLALCAAHFTEDSFQNLHEFNTDSTRNCY